MILLISIYVIVGFLMSQADKESSWNAGYATGMSSVPWSGRFPGEGMATQSNILAWKSHGQTSLADYSPRVHQELDMTKHACINKYIL